MATVVGKEFRSALRRVMTVVPPKPSMQFLSSVLLSAKEDGVLTLTGSDLTVTAIAELSAENVSPGTLSVPGKQLQAVLKTFPATGNIRIEFSTNEITLTNGALSVKVSGEPKENYPEFDVSTSIIGHVQAEHLYAARSRVLFAAAAERSRSLCCVGMHVGQRLEFTAADGFRLAHIGFADGFSGEADITVYPEVFRLFESGDKGEVLIGHTVHKTYFELNQKRLRMIVMMLNPPDAFPNFRKILPAVITDRAEVENADLLKQALQIAMQNKEFRGIYPVKLEFENDTLTATSKIAETSVPIRSFGKASLKLDAKLLLEAINTIDGVPCILVSQTESVIVTDRKGSESYPRSDVMHLIMPISR